MATPTASAPEVKQYTDPEHQKNNRPANNTLKYHFAEDDHNRDNFSEDLTADAIVEAFEDAHQSETIDGKKIRHVAVIAGGNRRTVQGGSKEIIEGGTQLAAWGAHGGLHAPEGWQKGLIRPKKAAAPPRPAKQQEPENPPAE